MLSFLRRLAARKDTEASCPQKPLPPCTAKARTGAEGEEAAAAHLCRLGWKLLARNWRSRQLELDIVAEDGETLVFVEVKTRRREHPDYPTLNAVDARRRKKLARASDVFASRIGEERRRRRFDVIVVIWPFFTERPTLTHHRGAFGYVDAVLGYRGNVGARRGRKKSDR